MTPFDDVTDFEVEFKSEAFDPYLETALERYSAIVLNWFWIALKAVLFFLFVTLCWAFLKWLGNGAKSTAERMWKKATDALADAFGRVIGYVIAFLLVIAFTMSFTANGYSFSKTFSWNGIVALYETWK